MYFLSIYWRAANSGHLAYKKVVILEKDNEYLRKAILNDLKSASKKFYIKVSKVIDLSENKGFRDESIKEFILSPFCRIYESNKVNNISVCFMFEGFFIEIYIKNLNRKDRKKHGLLSNNKNNLVVPYLNIFDIKEIVDLMIKGYDKHVKGNSKIKSNRS